MSIGLKQIVCIQKLLSESKLSFNFARFYSPTLKKSTRKKLPNESSGSNSIAWVANKKVQVLEDVKFDKKFAQRKIVDSVWLMNEYMPQVDSVEEAIGKHIELAQESMFNNPTGFLSARFILDMTTKTKTKFLDNIKGSINFPNFFKEGIQKEVIAICKKPAEIEAALSAGALMAGYEEILKKFENGEISDQIYDFLVCTPETFADVTLLKKKINKDKLPSLKTNTITESIGATVAQFHNSKNYESAKSNDEQGILKIKIGTLDMGVQKLTENLGVLVEKINSHKNYKKFGSNPYISDCVLYAPPSTEKFKVDISRFLVTNKEGEDDANESKIESKVANQ